MFYMKIVGADQGPFKSESKRAGDKGSLCVGFRFRADAAADQRRGTVQIAPLAVTKVWGPSSPQIMTALWQGEQLKDVVLEFVRQNEGGEEETFETLSLKNASIAYIDRRVGKVEDMAEGVHREIEEIGFRFESMEAKHHGAGGNTVAKYDWRHREGK